MKTTLVTLSETPASAFFFVVIKKIISLPLLLLGVGGFQNRISFPSFSGRIPMQNFKRNFKRQYLYLLPILLVGIVIVVSIGAFFKKTGENVQSATDQRVNINKPLAVEQLNRSNTYTLTDSENKTIKIKYTIQSCELRDQIVVKGQPAVAIKGRVFFVCNLKIVNNSTTGVAMQTKDYVRLIVDDSSDKLAPDIHNDPVQVQPISTKLTRLGFAIDDSAKKLVLQFGEINGKKDTIELNLLK